MKRGRGINGRDDRLSGIEIRMADALAKINPTDPKPIQFFFLFFQILQKSTGGWKKKKRDTEEDEAGLSD